MLSPSDLIHQIISHGQGHCTVNGWVWYCDVHDTHGNANFEAEAEFMADHHEMWWDLNSDDNEEGCDLHVFQRRGGVPC